MRFFWIKSIELLIFLKERCYAHEEVSTKEVQAIGRTFSFANNFRRRFQLRLRRRQPRVLMSCGDFLFNECRHSLLEKAVWAPKQVAMSEFFQTGGGLCCFEQ